MHSKCVATAWQNTLQMRGNRVATVQQLLCNCAANARQMQDKCIANAWQRKAGPVKTRPTVCIAPRPPRKIPRGTSPTPLQRASPKKHGRLEGRNHERRACAPDTHHWSASTLVHFILPRCCFHAQRANRQQVIKQRQIL